MRPASDGPAPAPPARPKEPPSRRFGTHCAPGWASTVALSSPLSSEPRLRSAYVHLGGHALQVFVQVRQALHFGDIDIIHAIPAAGAGVVAFPVLRVGH